MKTFVNSIFRLIIFLMASFGNVFSQSTNFSQFYNNALYLNPAFSATVSSYRLNLGYRQANLNLGNTLASNLISLEISKIGLYYVHSRSHKGSFRRQQLALAYAQNFRINRNWQISLGLTVEYLNNNFNLNNLVLEQAEGFNIIKSDRMSFGSGVLTYNKNWWFGLTFKNIYTFDFQTSANEIPLYLASQAGYQKQLAGTPLTFQSAFLAQYQNRQYQTDLGINAIYQNFILGTWFRGGYNFKRSGLDLDALILLTGIQTNSFQITYSYDFKISPLGGNLAGIHEIAFIFSKRFESKKNLPCPIY